MALTALLGAPRVTAAPTGSVSGRVQNADIGMYLKQARIRVEGTSLETFTDSLGDYHLDNVPAGAATLDVFYTGLASQRVPVTIPPGGTVRQDIAMTSPSVAGGRVVQLDTYVVASQRETNAQTIAINEQRFAPNIMNVVSTDAFGEINQGNIGEFVKHIPGVNIEFKDGNNPSGIDIRGFGTNYTRVTLDGNSMASAAIANTQTPNRQFVLEGASINNLSRIEVTKEPLPDMPANSMGGSVNLVSKSAFEYAHRQINFEGYLSANSYAMGLGKRGGLKDDKTYTTLPSFDGTLVLPINKKLGVVVTAANYDQYYNSKSMAPGRQYLDSSKNILAAPYIKSISASTAPNEVQSTSASIKVDYKPFEGNLLSFSASALAYRQDSAKHTISYSIGGGTPASWGETFTHGATDNATGGNSMGGGWQNRNALTRFIGVNYRFTRGAWDIKLAATYSNANNRVRDIAKGFFNSIGTTLHAINTKISGIKGATVNFDGIDNGTLGVHQVTVLDQNGNVVDTTKLANYDMGQIGSQPMNAQDSVTEYRGDAKRMFNTPWFPVAVQVGATTNNLVRDIHYSAQYWNYAGPDGIPTSGDETLAPFVDPNYSGSPGYNLPSYQWLSPWLVYDAFKAHPSWFYQTPGNIADKIKNEAVRSPLLMERVSAGYAMGDLRLFHNRVRLVGGVRYELTQDRGYGALQNSTAPYQRDASGNLIVVRDATGKPVLDKKGNVQYVVIPQLAGKDPSGPEYASAIYKWRGNYNSRNYHDYFPSADLTLNLTDNLLFRAAFAKTLGRPSPSDIVPTSTVSSNATFNPDLPSGFPGYIVSSNTSLVPWTAKNYDLSLEYYLPHNGLASIGVFRKDIRNFFGTIYKTADVPLLDSLGLSHDLVGYRWQTRINVGDARIDGLELSYSQDLSFAGSWGKMFSVFANMTKLRVTGANASTFDLKSGGGNIPTTGNAGLRFNYRRFSTGVYWNYRGKQFRDTSGSYPNARENVRAVQTWDADLAYQVSKHFSVFAAARNLNNAVTRWSLDGPGVPGWSTVESDYTNGTQYSLGVRGAF